MDDDAPRPARALVDQPVLESWGVAELRTYIAALQAEIGRAEAAIARKSDHRGAAEAVFGRKQGGAGL